MAVRSSMAALISRVRELINDTVVDCQVWSDQAIQDVLDESRIDVNYQLLTPGITATTSSIQYLDYYADVGNWEDDVTFVRDWSTSITPSASEPIAGHWTFATSQTPPVYIAFGKTYDIYRAAADLLERQAAKHALSFDASMEGQTLRRSQKMSNLLALANQYRRKQRPRSISMVRKDLSSQSITNRTYPIGLGPRPRDYGD